MSLDTNAIITVDELMGSMGLDRSNLSINMISIYNSSSDATAATVVKVGSTLTLTVTGGVNANTTAYDLSAVAYDTIGELITAIETLGKGWVVNRLCQSAQASTDLWNVSVSVLLVANEEILTGFDTLALEEIINAVSTFAEGFCKRNFTSQSYTEYHNGHGKERLRLNQYPVTAHTSVQSFDPYANAVISTLTENDEYVMENAEGVIYKHGSWAKGFKNYLVNYTAGYTATTMPEDLKYAVKEMSKWFYNNKDKAGVKAERIGRYAITYSTGTGGKNSIMGLDIPTHIVNLLAPYKKWDFPNEF
jgi:hypothetical protein